MIKVTASKVPIKADDLHEYEEAKRRWKTKPSPIPQPGDEEKADGFVSMAPSAAALQQQRKEREGRLGLGK